MEKIKRNVKINKTYATWINIVYRCKNENHPFFKKHGKIKFSKRWEKFENFLEDMGEKPIGKILITKNINDGYCKENCYWGEKEEHYKNLGKKMLGRKKNREMNINEKQCILNRCAKIVAETGSDDVMIFKNRNQLARYLGITKQAVHCIIYSPRDKYKRYDYLFSDVKIKNEEFDNDEISVLNNIIEISINNGMFNRSSVKYEKIIKCFNDQ